MIGGLLPACQYQLIQILRCRVSVDGVLILNRMVITRGLGRWIVEGGAVIEPTNASRFSMIEMEKDV